MSWAQIVSSINSNLSRALDQQISDRFNQVDARLNTLESQVTNAGNTIITSNATSDKVLERVSTWVVMASDNVRDGQNNVHVAMPDSPSSSPHSAFRLTFCMPGSYRVKVNFRSTPGPIIIFAGIPRYTLSNGALVPLHVFDITVTDPVTHLLRFVAPSTTVIFDISLCYDIQEILPKRLPTLTRL